MNEVARAIPVKHRELDDITLARARQGERSALDALIRHHQSAVYAVVGRMLVGHRRASVDDVAQDAFVKILHALHRFDPSGTASLSTWILTIATRTTIDYLRRAHRSDRIACLDPEDEHATNPPSPEINTAHGHQRARVEHAMMALAPSYRAVLVLRAYHDLDYSEIAEILGVAPGTVKSRLSRARLALRRAVGGFHD